MSEQSVTDQLRDAFSAQIEPQGWHIIRFEEQALTAHHSYLLMQPHKRNEVYAVYIAALTYEEAKDFVQCCKIYAFKDGRALPLEWWGYWI